MELIKIHRRHRYTVLHWLIENVAALRPSPTDYGYENESPTYINTAAMMAEWRAMDESWSVVETFPDSPVIRVYCADPLHATYVALKWS